MSEQAIEIEKTEETGKVWRGVNRTNPSLGGTKVPVIRYCPITGNQPMRCTKQGFEASCRKFQALEKNRYEKISTRSESLTAYCLICLGDKLPGNVTFISLPEAGQRNKENTDMGKVTYKPGKCECCGKQKNTTRHLGQMVCSSCLPMRGAVNNNADLVIKTLREFGKLPAMDAGNSDLVNALKAENKDLRDSVEKLSEDLVGGSKTNDDLRSRIEELSTDNENLKSQLREAAEDLQSYVRGSISLPVPELSGRDGYLLDLALDVIEGRVLGVDAGRLRALR